jgi:alcohol dehydrogenase (cytochrome c)
MTVGPVNDTVMVRSAFGHHTMPRRLRFCLSLLVLFCAMATTQRADAGDVTDKTLAAAANNTDDWLIYGRDYSNQRFSPLDQINRDNVKRLVPKWIYQTGTAATFQTNPLIHDGVMFVTAPFSHVSALNAETGQRLWHYEHKRTSKKLCCSPANRGVALGYGRVYVATVDARLIALDQKNGRVIWDKPMAVGEGGPTEDQQTLGEGSPLANANVTGSTGVGAVAAPLVYKGLVIVGITGVGYGLHLDSERPGAPLGAVVGIAGRYGRPGFIAAYDAKTGDQVWRFDTTQKGWEGGFSPTTPDGVSLNRDIAQEKADAAKHKDAWRHGGGSIWQTPAVDTELGVIYFGVGNPSPQAAGEGRPGDDLYTVALVALEAATGKLAWYYQQVPHDIWGYDVASPPSLFDVTIDGKSVPAVGQASKLGWYYVHDRRDGELLYKSDAFVPQENMFALPTPEGTRISPGVGGGANWSPASVDQKSGMAYVAALHLPTIYKSHVLPAHAGKPAVDYFSMELADEETWGTLTAIDLKNNGRIAWQQKTDEHLVGGVVATAGGLVFTGEGNGQFSAFDAETGKRLWRFNCGAGVNAPPVTYAVNGKQFVVAAAGGSKIWGFRQGGAIVAFGLAEPP